MRLNLLLCRSRHAREPQNENNVPIKPTKPLVLKNTVSGKLQRSLEDKCLFEMSLLFKCWKENQFNDTSCLKDMQKLQECHTRLIKNTAAQKELQQVNIPPPGTKTFTNKQISYLLHMYPTV